MKIFSLRLKRAIFSLTFWAIKQACSLIIRGHTHKPLTEYLLHMTHKIGSRSFKVTIWLFGLYSISGRCVYCVSFKWFSWKQRHRDAPLPSCRRKRSFLQLWKCALVRNTGFTKWCQVHFKDSSIWTFLNTEFIETSTLPTWKCRCHKEYLKEWSQYTLEK